MVQASTGNVVATISCGCKQPVERPTGRELRRRAHLGHELLRGNSVTVFKAADLSFIANVDRQDAGVRPNGACSDGINFWVGLGTGNLLRF